MGRENDARFLCGQAVVTALRFADRRGSLTDLLAGFYAIMEQYYAILAQFFAGSFECLKNLRALKKVSQVILIHETCLSILNYETLFRPAGPQKRAPFYNPLILFTADG